MRNFNQGLVYGDNAAPVVTGTQFGPSVVYVGGAGVVQALDARGDQIAVTVPAGGVVPFLCTGVVAASTTATLMVRIF